MTTIGTISRKKWSEEESEILKEALSYGKFNNLTELCRTVAGLIGRTEGAVAARIYAHYREALDNVFGIRSYGVNTEEQVEMEEQVEEQVQGQVDEQLEASENNPIEFNLFVPQEEIVKEELDSRSIFDLYESLAKFKDLVAELREENSTLRRYYELSETEITRLRKQLSETNEERNRTVEHIKSIQSIITSLSESAFGEDLNKQEEAV